MSKLSIIERSTMQPVFTASLIRSLRGSPLTVLIACIFLESSGQVPVTINLLKTITGYGDHTISDALRLLTDTTNQSLIRVTGGWRISCSFQLPLSINSQNRENRGFGGYSSSSSKSNPDSFLLEEEEEEGKNRENRGFQENLSILLAHGVGEPKASQLAKLHHVTPDFINAHFTAIKGSTLTIGTAIYRIEHNWTSNLDLLPSPPKKHDSHSSNRYIEGEFADFIEH